MISNDKFGPVDSNILSLTAVSAVIIIKLSEFLSGFEMSLADVQPYLIIRTCSSN